MVHGGCCVTGRCIVRMRIGSGRGAAGQSGCFVLDGACAILKLVGKLAAVGDHGLAAARAED